MVSLELTDLGNATSRLYGPIALEKLHKGDNGCYDVTVPFTLRSKAKYTLGIVCQNILGISVSGPFKLSEFCMLVFLHANIGVCDYVSMSVICNA